MFCKYKNVIIIINIQYIMLIRARADCDIMLDDSW